MYCLVVVLSICLAAVLMEVIGILYATMRISDEVCIVALTILEVSYIYINGLAAERYICKQLCEKK
jgi:hypothetical protein